MSEHTKKHLVTAALPYANGPLHIGHIAGAYLPADIYVRYLKMKGEDVAFICGSDEHGAAITLRAKKEGTTPQEIVDKYHEINKKAFKDFGILFDKYSRTSNQLHHDTAQDFFKTLDSKGVFERKTTEQFYDEENKQFLADRYITGECPNCHSPNAYGDQCEKCGSALSPTDLIDPKSSISGNTPILKETSHWFLPMQNDETWLKEWIETGKLDGEIHHDPKSWRNQVIGQCKSWIDGGLQPRAMTRDLDWGVEVPVKGAVGKVLYVWLDAPIGYISGTKEWASENGKNWEEYWKEDNVELVHFIGKDNIVFHAIIFPIILKAHGEYVLPTNVVANEFLNLEGDKLSTSRNWAVWLHEYLEDFPNRQDELRYVLTSIAPESKDSEFTWADFQARVNNELVAILGNFITRAVVLANKFIEGKMPILPVHDIGLDEKQSIIQLETELSNSILKIFDSIEKYKFREAQTSFIELARIGNRFLQNTKPWEKTINESWRKVVLGECLNIVAHIGLLSKIFLPNASKEIYGILDLNNTDNNAHSLKSWENSIVSLKRYHNYLMPSNTSVTKRITTTEAKPLLFQKIEDKDIQAQVEKLENNKKMNKPEPTAKPQLPAASFDDFTKLDIRVGTILEAEKVPKANKLLKLLVDTGLDKRTVVSGIAEHYNTGDVVGKQVSVLMNLAPRKIRGVESQGMILMAEDREGNLSFVSPEKDVESGSEIR